MITGVSDRFLLLFALPDHYLIMGRHHLVGVTVPTGTAGLGLFVYSKDLEPTGSHKGQRSPESR